MCGIAGIVNFGRQPRGTPSRRLVLDMIAALRHRGPDEFGLYRDECAALAHARLSIIDLAGGKQPLSNESGNLWISFNGEIFNFVELRQQLEASGHMFCTASDTEVIIHAYEEWGEECFGRLNGQWALALWDATRRRLVLSRDRMGIRPLYVAQDGNRLLFASEVKAIFADQTLSREFDPAGLAQVFTYWGPVAPQTLFKGVEELPPAAVWSYAADGACRKHIFWTPSFEVFPEYAALSTAEATELLRDKLETATRLRTLRADVPVGSYLSGGLDSSVIAALGRRAKQGEFQTFSLRFEDSEFDETGFQRRMAERLGSRHEEVVIRRAAIAATFPDVVYHTERPILRTAPAPMFLLSRLVRQSGIKSVLTGEGADEVLAGYDIFREAKLRRFWARQPQSTCRPLLFDRLYPYLARAPQQAKGMALAFWRQGLAQSDKPGFSHGPRWQTTSSIQRLFLKDFVATLQETAVPDVLSELPTDFGNWPRLGQDQFLEIMTLFGPYLISSQGDRMLMANSVEGRFPFLDVNLMEFCNHLPPAYRLRVLNEKYLLKKAAADLVPPEIIARKKQPYRAPDAISFVSGDVPDYVGEILAPEAVADAGIFEPRKVELLHRKLREKARRDERPVFSNADNMALVGIISTQLLAEQYIRRMPEQAANPPALQTDIDRVVS